MVVLRAAGLLMRAIAAFEPRYLRAYSASMTVSMSGRSAGLTSTQVTPRAFSRVSSCPWWRDLVERYQAASGPFTDRRYSSSPTLTIQTIRFRDIDPSRRTELSSTSPALPNKSSSSLDQAFV
jgi:hypothetical protein